MNTPQDGGPAFPIPGIIGTDGNFIELPVQGMSLRDWFAGMALPKAIEQMHYYTRKALENEVKNGDIAWIDVAKSTDADCIAHKAECAAYAAYRYADAMIEARKEDA